jgi:hypothetical protein
MSDTIDPPPDWYLYHLARRAALSALQNPQPFVPGPDPVVEAQREAQALRDAGRLN